MTKAFDKSHIFFKIYANLDIKERGNISVVIDGEPISWKIAYIEIKNKTKIGEKILKRLDELKII